MTSTNSTSVERKAELIMTTFDRNHDRNLDAKEFQEFKRTLQINAPLQNILDGSKSDPEESTLISVRVPEDSDSSSSD